jgi:hypothetical protein
MDGDDAINAQLVRPGGCRTMAGWLPRRRRGAVMMSGSGPIFWQVRFSQLVRRTGVRSYVAFQHAPLGIV